MTDYRIKTVEEYRELRGDSHQMIYDKSMTVIDDHIRDFLALSTFLTVASIDAEGRMDVSPKVTRPGLSRSWTSARSLSRNVKGTGAPTPSQTFFRSLLSG